jgi:hypothetical protein
VSFHTCSLPEDRCVRLLAKNLGKRMPESVVREEVEFLNIRVQEVLQLQSGRCDQDPAKVRSPTHLFIVSVVLVPEESTVRSLTELCGLRLTMESYTAPKGPLQCQHSVSAIRSASASREGAHTPLVNARHLGAASTLQSPGRPHGELPGLC